MKRHPNNSLFAQQQRSYRQVLVLLGMCAVSFLLGFNVRGILSSRGSSSFSSSDGDDDRSLKSDDVGNSGAIPLPGEGVGRTAAELYTNNAEAEGGAPPPSTFAAAAVRASEKIKGKEEASKQAIGAYKLHVGEGKDARDHRLEKEKGEGGESGRIDDKSDIEDEEDRRRCLSTVTRDYINYYARATSGEALKKVHGQLHIAAFSRLWVPPLHGTGGMQFHAYHLYSQLAARGHRVHVFVTGPPEQSQQRTLYFKIDKKTNTPKEIDSAEATAAGGAPLTVQQVPSKENSEYSVLWFENCLEAFRTINATNPFHVAHSESWAAVPNTYQIGLQMAVTWHGSMLDWFRNEINLIVHNFRVKGKMVGEKTAQRMSQLGTSVAYEAYQLLSVPHHIVISDSAADDLAAINLVDPSRVHLIYNGVNPTNFKPPSDRDKVRTEFIARHAPAEVAKGFDTKKSFIVGCGGRLEGIKGHHQLSEAMGIILPQHADVILVVAGTGEQGRRYQQLQRQGLRVVMLGMLKQTDLALFYQSLDVFVDPFYQHHGLNTVMLESTLSGVPIVASRLASSKTTAPCSQFGRTFQLGVISELVGAILYFRDHPEERTIVGKNVRDRAVHLFSSEVMAGSYEALMYDMYLNPMPLVPMTGKVVCKRTYPAMCYREPSLPTSGEG